MKSKTEELLKLISNWDGTFTGAFNIREDGGCAGRQSTEHIKIETKQDLPGLDIRILPGTKGETVSIPACVTHGDVDDLVYNDFYVGEYADVTIVAGCGVHTENGITGSTGSFWRRAPGSSTWKSTWAPAAARASAPSTPSPSAT